MAEIFQFKPRAARTAVSAPTAAQPKRRMADNLATEWSHMLMEKVEAAVQEANSMPEKYSSDVRHGLVFPDGITYGRLNIWSPTTKTLEELQGIVVPAVRVEVEAIPDDEEQVLSGTRTDMAARKFMAYHNEWAGRQDPDGDLPPHIVIPSVILQTLLHDFYAYVAYYRLPSSAADMGTQPIMILHEPRFGLKFTYTFSLNGLLIAP